MSKKRVTADRFLSHVKKIGATNWCQESINDILCTLQYKGSIDDNIKLPENEEDLTNHEDIDLIYVYHL